MEKSAARPRAGLQCSASGPLTYGSIVGTVADETGGVIPGTQVTLTNIGTNEQRTMKTDASGLYRWRFGHRREVHLGWGVNGVTTFQSGFPIALSTSQNLSNSFGGSQRPNNNGTSAELDGDATSRLNEWFNTGVFSQPAAFTFGNTGRTLADVRSHGIANFDFAIFKNTQISERVGTQFRAEFFNIANRTQFGTPGASLGTAQFGVVNTQVNSPRLVQFALRVLF